MANILVIRAKTRVLLFLLFTLSLALSRTALALDPLLPGKLSQYMAKVRAAQGKEVTLAAILADAGSGKEIFSEKPKELVIPASVLKIITTSAALKHLGAEYRFPTEVFVDSLPSDNNQTLDTSLGLDDKRSATSGSWKAGNLYVRGYGDPGLIEEQLLGIAQVINNYGVREIDNLVIDDSLFIDPPPAGGPRPYQAALSATSLNHNCYKLTVAPSGPGLDAIVSLTPGLPVKLSNRVKTLRNKGKSITLSQSPTSSTFNPNAVRKKVGDFYDLLTGEITVIAQGRIGRQEEMVSYYQSVASPAEYFGLVFRHLLQKVGIEVKGRLLLGETPAKAKLLHVHQSEPLNKILNDLNHYSSNFVAGQILYVLGQDSVGFFRKDLGLQRLSGVLEGLGYKPEEFVIADASGLARGNKVSVEQLLKVLLANYRDFTVAPDFLSSLSRFGQTGTLKKRVLVKEERGVRATGELYRERKRRADGVWGKTGTLDGVSSLAGYLEVRTGERLAFVVITNGLSDKKAAMAIEDEFVKIIIEADK